MQHSRLSTKRSASAAAAATSAATGDCPLEMASATPRPSIVSPASASFIVSARWSAWIPLRWKAVATDEWDEAGAGHCAPRGQLAGLPFEQCHVFAPSAADRLDEPPSFGQLVGER